MVTEGISGDALRRRLLLAGDGELVRACRAGRGGGLGDAGRRFSSYVHAIAVRVLPAVGHDARTSFRTCSRGRRASRPVAEQQHHPAVDRPAHETARDRHAAGQEPPTTRRRGHRGLDERARGEIERLTGLTVRDVDGAATRELREILDRFFARDGAITGSPTRWASPSARSPARRPVLGKLRAIWSSGGLSADTPRDARAAAGVRARRYVCPAPGTEPPASSRRARWRVSRPPAPGRSPRGRSACAAILRLPDGAALGPVAIGAHCPERPDAAPPEHRLERFFDLAWAPSCPPRRCRPRRTPGRPPRAPGW